MDGETKFKARYVAGGNQNVLEDYLLHQAQTLQATSVRLILALSSIYGFEIRSTEITFAYLQSAAALKHAMYVKNLAQEFELEPNECLQLVKHYMVIATPEIVDTIRSRITFKRI